VRLDRVIRSARVVLSLLSDARRIGTNAGEDAVSHVIPDRDVIANADRAYMEIRALLDHQVRTAESLDTKAGALLTVLVAAAAIAAPRLQLDSPDRVTAGIICFALVVLLAAFVLGTLWPRGFSYGADATALAASLEEYSQASIALARAEAVRDAWQRNDDALDSKHLWYSCSLISLPAILASIGYMVSVQAVTNASGT
jgi:hypothetical protein